MTRVTAIITNEEETGLFVYEIVFANYTLRGDAESFDAAVAIAIEEGATETLDHCE